MDDVSKDSSRQVRAACACYFVQQILSQHLTDESTNPTGPASSGDEGNTDFPGDGVGTSVEGGKKQLEDELPFYLHVSGWLDASANAAIMAFMSIPCRCVIEVLPLYIT